MFYKFPLHLQRKPHSKAAHTQRKNSAHNELVSAIEDHANGKVRPLSENTVTHFDVAELMKATGATRDEIFYALGGNHGFDLGR